ncbi:MAG: hypothetical protein ACRC14_17470 [Paracoccaceae bacterium]
MIHDIKSILTEGRTLLIEDATGVAILFALLFAGLTLTGTA